MVNKVYRLIGELVSLVMIMSGLTFVFMEQAGDMDVLKGIVMVIGGFVIHMCVSVPETIESKLEEIREGVSEVKSATNYQTRHIENVWLELEDIKGTSKEGLRDIWNSVEWGNRFGHDVNIKDSVKHTDNSDTSVKSDDVTEVK